MLFFAQKYVIYFTFFKNKLLNKKCKQYFLTYFGLKLQELCMLQIYNNHELFVFMKKKLIYLGCNELKTF